MVMPLEPAGNAQRRDDSKTGVFGVITKRQKPNAGSQVAERLVDLTKQPRDGDIQALCDCSDLVVHYVTSLIFYAGNRGLVDDDPLPCKPSCEIVLRYRRAALEASLSYSVPDQIASSVEPGPLHPACGIHILD